MRHTIATALKEWASVVNALKEGRQVLLLRKGGLADRGGFTVQDDEFLLYPTLLHQQADFIKPEHAEAFRASAGEVRPTGGVRFDCYAVVHRSMSVTSRDALERLEGHHIWNQRFLDQRLKWQPESPACVLFLRVYRLAEPVHVPEQRRYRGCRSWVTLEQPLSILDAEPALSDAAFHQAVESAEAALAGATARA